MIFDRFKDEAEFRSNFVRPLLTRLGFVSVAELHGSQEFGKDFVFSELTPFGFIRHYAAVVKHEKSVSQSNSSLCSTVLAQARQAFSVTFRLPDNDAVHKVSSVVVFNSGKVTDNAREWLRAELDEERYGRNVHVLDGERLFQLDVTAASRLGEQLRPRLQGMLNDLDLNVLVWKSLFDSLPSFCEARGSFTTALDGFLAAPFLIGDIDIQEVAVLVQECRLIDAINSRYMQSIHPKGEKRAKETETIKILMMKAGERVGRLKTQLQAALLKFRPLTSQEWS